MTIVMRNLLEKYFCWHKSGSAFDQSRFFDSKSMYSKAAE